MKAACERWAFASVVAPHRACHLNRSIHQQRYASIGVNRSTTPTIALRGEGGGGTSAGVEKSTVVGASASSNRYGSHPVDFSMIDREVVRIGLHCGSNTRKGRDSSSHSPEIQIGPEIASTGGRTDIESGGKADATLGRQAGLSTIAAGVTNADTELPVDS